MTWWHIGPRIDQQTTNLAIVNKEHLKMPTSYLIQYHKGYVLVHESYVRYGSCTEMMEIYTSRISDVLNKQCVFKNQQPLSDYQNITWLNSNSHHNKFFWFRILLRGNLVCVLKLMAWHGFDSVIHFCHILFLQLFLICLFILYTCYFQHHKGYFHLTKWCE